MRYQFHFRPYRRPFRQPVITNHGRWAMREGIILRLTDAVGQSGWGEIAPIPWFGSETIEQALEFCCQLPSELSNELIFSIPDALPSCQFAFESAWEGMREQAIGKTTPQRRSDAESQVSFAAENSTLRPQRLERQHQRSTRPVQRSTLRPQRSINAAQNVELRPQSSQPEIRPASDTPHPTPVRLNAHVEAHSPFPTPHSLPYSALLPAGNAAIHAWKPLWEQGFRTFKWKIGVYAIAIELEILCMLIQALPSTANLRLDANGGLSTDDATQWLQACDAITADPNSSAGIEYIEQPLPVAQFQTMQGLSQHHTTPIALDESVATLHPLQTCYDNGWRGIFVIKPAIVGSPSRLRQFCQTHAIDAVFSSAFETAIGRQAGLRLAEALGNPDRALGYGITHWFDNAELSDFEQLWQTL